MAFELVIFDCDGVLVDSEPLANRELAAMLTDLGIATTTEESMARFMGRAWDTITPLIEADLGRPLPAGFVDAYHERVFAAFDAELRPVPGVETALDALERDGIATCVASSGSHEKIRRSLALTGLLPRFDGRIFSAADVPRGKPAPDLFLNARRTLAHERAVVVEDSAIGIEAARAARMPALGYAGRTPPDRLSRADRVFADMAELPALIRDCARG